MCSLPFFSFSPILVIFWLLYRRMELETRWLMTNPLKNLEFLAFDFSLDHIYYSSLGTASGSLVPKLETAGYGDKSISRGLIDEKSHFCNVPRECLQCSNVNSEIYVTFQGITAITSGQGSGTPVQGVFLSLLPLTVVLPINLVLGDWSEGRNGAKATQRQMAEDEVLGRKFLRKVCILARLCFFQYDSVLVRNKCFGCSSRTEPVAGEDLGRRALLLSEDPLSSLPKSVCSGSGKNAKRSTYVSEMPHGVCYSPAIWGSRSCQLVTTQGNPRRILPHLPGVSSLLSD